MVQPMFQRTAFLRHSTLSVFVTVVMLGSGGCEETIFKPQPTVDTGPDTTTHNWRFEVDTIGGHNSLTRDIVAFSEDDAWVTGIFTEPNDPNEEVKYNLAHWDGKRWTMMRFGQLAGMGATTLFAVDKNFMMGEAYGFYLHNGSYWSKINIPFGIITKGIFGMWGNDKKQVHWVGGEGGWFTWDGNVESPSIRRLQTPTSIDLYDIYGDGDRIYACGVTPTWDDGIILKYENGKITEFDSTQFPRAKQVFSLWYNEKEDILAIAGEDVIIYKHEKRYRDADSLDNIIPYTGSVRGSAANNIWWVGGSTTLVHFNGSSFRVYNSLSRQNAILQSVSVHDSYFFACGVQTLQNGTLCGIIIRGYKQ